MDYNLLPHIVHEAYIEDHRTDGLRSGEGAVERLADGSLYMLYGQFAGGSDFASASLVSRRSTDGGFTWSSPALFRAPPPGATNVMSASLLRLSDGRLASLHCVKHGRDDCRPAWQTSDDEAKSWSEPKLLMDQPDYYVVNNDRLVQLSTGRLLVPFCVGEKRDGKTVALGTGICGCLISDDLGGSWHMGQSIQIGTANFLAPRFVDANNPDALRIISERRAEAQEPGVIELSNGRVMMWCRTQQGHAYRAISTDGGDTWSPFQAIADFTTSGGPQSIKRLPGSNRLIMLYNDRGRIPFGSSQFTWRRPLSLAVSDDEAATWQPHGQLEPNDVPSNCYYSIAFDEDRILFTYYEGAMETSAEGLYRPRNLASLKLKIIRRTYFEQ